MKSTWGRRGAIIANYHWTYDYLLWGISWSTVMKMLSDGPRYDSDEKGEPIELTEDNAEEIIEMLNSMV